MRVIVVCALAIFSTVGETAYNKPHYESCRGVMAYLFEWKFKDIAKECEFLGSKRYGGVLVGPIEENVIITIYNSTTRKLCRPWWEHYNVISYRIISRLGTFSEFKDMVCRCNKVGVRIYVNIVINNMSSDWTCPLGTGNSTADTCNRSYPEVPYFNRNFHKPYCIVNDFQNVTNVRNCDLFGGHDLNQTEEYVREKICDLMNKLINTGVAGFRIDAAKHMWPSDLEVIYSRLKNLNIQHGFANGLRPYIFQEVIDYNPVIVEPITKYNYSNLGAVTEFLYPLFLYLCFTKQYNTLSNFRTFGFNETWFMLPSKDALIFIDNHDTQRANNSALTYKMPKLYKMATAFMLAWPYGQPCIMSSFYFVDYDQGPPSYIDGEIMYPTGYPKYNCSDGQCPSSYPNEMIMSPIIYPNGSCGNGWVCEHRWRPIYNMVYFRNSANDTDINNWWDNGQNQIAFCRGSVGLVAINNDNFDFKQTLRTTMPHGTYCDVISGNLVKNKCTGKTVKVDKDGKAYVEILTTEEDGVLAIHKDAKLK